MLDLATLTSQDTAVVVNVENPDPMITLKSVEVLQFLPPGTRLYKCHLASKAGYKQFSKDDDNIIYGSQSFHNYLDGMRTANGELGFALRYDGYEGQFNVVVDQFENVRPMWKVKVIFEFRDNSILEW